MTSPVRTKRDGRKVGARTRQDIIEALQEYYATYGQPTTASFNPSTAKWRDDQESIDRYYTPRKDGSQWPSLNSIKDLFDGSFNEALKAAGLPENKPGPGRRRPNVHAPVRDVRVERVLVPSDESRRLRAELEHARARAEKAEARARALAPEVKVVREPVDTSGLERKIERLREQLNTEKGVTRELARQLRAIERKAPPKPKTITKIKTVEKVVQAKVPVQTLAQTAEIDRLTTRLASAEGREERLRAQLAHKDELLTEARRSTEALRGQLADVRERVTAEAVQSAMVARSERRAAQAEARIADVEKQMAEQARAVIGELRPLTAAEVASLRASGPAGPAVLAKAIRGLQRAQAGSQGRLREALTELAAAAINWRDRLG